MTRRPAHRLPGPPPPLAARRVGFADHRRGRHGPPAGATPASAPSSCRRCSRRRSSTRRSSSTGPSRPGTEHVRRGARLLPRRSSDSPTPASATCAASRRSSRQASVPVIASLNATSAGGWVRYARRIADAGADALELNLYRLAADPAPGRRRHGGGRPGARRGGPGRGDHPARRQAQPVLHRDGRLRRAASSPHGADGLVLFNRFYQPDLDLEALEVVNRVELSRPGSCGCRCAGSPILRPQLGPGVSLAATSGIHSGADALKALMVGADVAMMTSALLRHGPEHVRTVEAELRAWMADHEYESVGQLRGSASQTAVGRPSGLRPRQLHAHAALLEHPARADPRRAS